MVTSQDPLNIWNGERFEFTLKKLCDIIFDGRPYTMPVAFRSVQDKPIDRVTADTMPAKKGHRVVFDLSWNTPESESKKKILGYIKSGIIVVTNRKYEDRSGKSYPVIRIRDPWEAWIILGKYVKAVFPMPTIGITGSAGKTTTTMFAECVFNERYKTFVSGLNGRNFNTTLQIVNQWILRVDPSYTFHVQECGAETIDLIKSSAQVLNVDGFGITNIDTSQHIATYKTAENLIADKTSFDRVRNENTFGVINLDDEILRNYKFKSPLITFAINDESADYVGKNIVQNGELLEFDVVSKEETVHIKIHIVGNHNVYNALLVFAFAKKFGLSNEEIQNGFLKYESVGIRQYLRNVGGRLLYMDAYNASVESTQLCVKTLQEMSVPEYGRKIAIIGERKTSNEETFNINYNLGRSLAEYDNIDEFIIVGEDPKRLTGKPEAATLNKKYRHAVLDGARSVMGDDRKLSYYTDLRALADRIKYQTKPGDAILFKGRYHLSLWSVADMAFGTGYTKTEALIPLSVTKSIVSTKSIKGEYYPCFDGINLLSATNGFDNTKIVLPATVDNKPIVRIGDNAFANKSQLRMFVFCSRVKSIGDCAFKNCAGLEQIELPKGCCYIGISAFEDCTGVSRASLLGVAHISKAAFKGCSNLKQVVLTEKCAAIENEAFDGCTNLTICAPADSYAEQWAKANNFKFEEIDSDEELEKIALNGTRLNPNIYSLGKYEMNEAPAEDTPQENSNITSLSIVTAGDIMVHDAHLTGLYDKAKGVYNFDKFFENTTKYFKAADLAIGNVETSFGPGRPTGFPKFSSPDELAESIAKAGISISASANNHIFDTNHAGVIRTRRILESYGIDVAGIRKDENEKAYVITERKGVKIALINYTYRTQSKNGYKTLNTHILDADSAKLINTFCFETLDYDLENINTEIKNAKADGADIVLVYYHWGCEYECKSNVIQKYMAYRTAQMGADAILGSHSHVLQEISSVTVDVNGKKKTVPVFYGIGNYSWASRLPRKCRETVHNGALAKLNIEYNKEAKEIVSIKTDFVPLYIKTDYIYNKFDFSILSINDMNEEEIESFNLRSINTIDEISDQIKETLCGENSKQQYDFCFDHVIEVAVGTRVPLSDEKFISVRSENAPVVSVLQSMELIGNTQGFAGVVAQREDGSSVAFVVKVSGTGNSNIPVLIDKFNMVPDIYRPKNLVSGVEYGLPAAVSLEKGTAEAWRAMRLSAANQGVYICCTSGYRTNETHLKKIISLAEEFDMDTAEEKLMPVGFTEHHTGTVLDAANVSSKGTTIEDVFDWLDDNAHIFGFVSRQAENDKHRHLWYVGNPIVAKLIKEDNITRAQYIENFDDYNKRAEAECAWQNNYLPEEKIDEPMEEWTELTLKRICDIIGIEVPMIYEDIQHRIVPVITLTDLDMVPGGIYFYDKILKNRNVKVRSAFRNGAVLAITDTPVRNEGGNLMPQIKVHNAFDCCIKLGQYFRKKSSAKVIAIAENNKQIMRNILVEQLNDSYNILKNETDVDNRINLFSTIQAIKPEHQLYIQNIRHVLPGYMKKNAEMLLPDIAVATKVKVKRPTAYKSIESYKNDRCAVIETTLQNGGTVFMDIDEPLYADYIGKENVVTYSINKNKNADYYIRKTSVKKKTAEISIKYTKNKTKAVVKVSASKEKCLDYVMAAIAVKDYLNNK